MQVTIKIGEEPCLSLVGIPLNVSGIKVGHIEKYDKYTFIAECIIYPEHEGLVKDYLNNVDFSTMTIIK